MRQVNKILLIGYRCTGKTSIGKRLAERLGIPFIDTDDLVQKAAGKTIKDIIEDNGWAFFREREKEVIKSLTALGESVIATGGGAVMDERNAALLKKAGVLIWLTADEKTIVKRILADAATVSQRPRFSAQDLQRETRDILAVRMPVYRRLADFSIDTTVDGIEESVDRIARFLADHGNKKSLEG